MKRHQRDSYFVVGEGILRGLREGGAICDKPSNQEEMRRFRFSRLGPKGPRASDALATALAEAMTKGADPQPDSAAPRVPAAVTYLGQFIDHDLTFDRTEAKLGDHLSVQALMQGRSPALDLDSLYGDGPDDPQSSIFYADRMRLKMGVTAAVPGSDTATNVDRDGFDLPRRGGGGTKKDQRQALIPDARNDENLAVAQLHLAFIRFHNRVVDHLAAKGTPSADLFAMARETVVKHYQWVLKTDYLHSIVQPEIVHDVFNNGRRFFEVGASPDDHPTMPIEFSVAAFRLGHSMIRDSYEWNKVFRRGGPATGTLPLLFQFSGTSGNLSPGGDLTDPESGAVRLPTNWIADWRRLVDFKDAQRPDLAPPDVVNLAKRIDTLLVDPLRTLPLGSFGGTPPVPTIEQNLAFRNLRRAAMVELASGQAMAKLMNVEPLTRQQLLVGKGGADLSGLGTAQQDELAEAAPLWFYILREAELNNGRLAGVGGRLVAEVFHRAMEGSAHSIVRNPSWRPTLVPDSQAFRFVELLLFAFEGKPELLNPLGD